LQVLFDYAVVVLITIGVIVLQGQPRQAMPQGVSMATWLFLISSASGIYQQPGPQQSWVQVWIRTGLAVLLGLPLAVMVLSVAPSIADSALISFAATAGVAAVISYRIYLSHRAAQPVQSRVLVVGTGASAELVGRTLKNNRHASVVGYCASPNEAAQVPPPHLLTPGGSLAATAAALGVTDIVVAVSDRRGGSMPMRELLDCRIRGVKVYDTTTFFERALGQIRVDFVNAGWLIFGDGFRQGAVRTALKRASDVLGSLVLLAVFAPVILVTMCLIRLESSGPVLFRQQRVGRNGRLFDVLKFRSMRTDAEADGQPRWATEQDDRITRVGRVIRLLRIDELPQLFNVLAGDMSLIGPRPERPYFVDQLVAQLPYYAIRHSVKPGVTGWAQVRYHYGSTVEDAKEKLQYDLYYVKNHNLWLDCQIILETVTVVLTGKGAR
jgi:sugar transferase (PEP-CTERM system associated)